MYDFYRGSYLTSNGTIANIVFHDLDLNFQDQTVKMAILTNDVHLKFQGKTIQVTILTRLEKEQTLPLPSDRKPFICH